MDDGRHDRDGARPKRAALNSNLQWDQKERPDGMTVPGSLSRPIHPYIHVPMVIDGPNGPSNTCTIVPTYENMDPGQLSPEALAVITQGRPQIAKDVSGEWRYSMRRQPQKMLDFLYLGPSMAAKDKDFLQREGITMLLLVRDEMMAHTRLLSIERVAAELGLASASIDVRSGCEVSIFSQAVRLINDHLLGVYRQQLQLVPKPAAAPEFAAPESAVPESAVPEGSAMIDSSRFRRGKVLVYCETGNVRSPMVAAAYMMATYGLGMVTAIQFIILQRFCVNFDDDTKHVLRTWDELITARRDVGRASAEERDRRLKIEKEIQDAYNRRRPTLTPSQADSSIPSPALPTLAKSKRAMDDMMDDGDDAVDPESRMDMDVDRDVEPFVGTEAHMD